jgi:hypothetical protein
MDRRDHRAARRRQDREPDAAADVATAWVETPLVALSVRCAGSIGGARPAVRFRFNQQGNQVMDKIDFMNGQIKALVNFATAVIRSHPSPETLRHQFETIARAEPNSPEGLSLSEAYVDGIADIDRQIAIVLEHTITNAQRRDPDTD